MRYLGSTLVKCKCLFCYEKHLFVFLLFFYFFCLLTIESLSLSSSVPLFTVITCLLYLSPKAIHSFNCTLAFIFDSNEGSISRSSSYISDIKKRYISLHAI